jgi:hypothetical protein
MIGQDLAHEIAQIVGPIGAELFHRVHTRDAVAFKLRFARAV